MDKMFFFRVNSSDFVELIACMNKQCTEVNRDEVWRIVFPQDIDHLLRGHVSIFLLPLPHKKELYVRR